MRKVFLLLAVLCAISIGAKAQTITPPAQLPSNAQALTQMLGPAYQQPYFTVSPNTLVVTYSGGWVFNGNGPQLINPGSVTLTASATTCARPGMTSCDFIYWTSGTGLATTQNFQTATANGNVLLAAAVTNSSGVTSLEAMYQDGSGPPPNYTVSDGYFMVPPGACALNLSGGTLSGTNGMQIVGTSFTPVNLLATTTATETTTITCHITFNSRTTASKGMTLNDVTLLYGNSVGATATCNAPTLNTITLPTPGTGETASTVAPVSIGAVTVTPVVGSCNTAAVTAGQFYTEKVALNTPYAISTDFTDITFQQSFVGPASASYTLYTGGLIAHVSQTLF